MAKRKIVYIDCHYYGFYMLTQELMKYDFHSRQTATAAKPPSTAEQNEKAGDQNAGDQEKNEGYTMPRTNTKRDSLNELCEAA